MITILSISCEKDIKEKFYMLADNDENCRLSKGRFLEKLLNLYQETKNLKNIGS